MGMQFWQLSGVMAPAVRVGGIGSDVLAYPNPDSFAYGRLTRLLISPYARPHLLRPWMGRLNHC